MNLKIYIFAGGDNTRWNYDYPKEMAVVDDEPVIFRTVRQCQERHAQPIIVTHKPEILQHKKAAYLHFVTNRFDTLAHACLSVDWGTNCIFLLGDVYYTDYAWERIQGVPRFFFGNEVEIFAVKFPELWQQKMRRSLEMSVRHWMFDGGKGKLWQTYRAYEGYDLDVQSLGPNFLLIEDETTDFDTVEEYERFLNEHS